MSVVGVRRISPSFPSKAILQSLVSWILPIALLEA